MSALGVAAAGVAGLVLKATLVMCLALALAWLARRGSARTLHLLWTTTFVVLLALPIVSLLGPSWPVPILPAGDAQAGVLSLEKSLERASAAGMPREMPGAPISGGSLRQATRPTTASGSSPVESGLPQFGASDLPSPLALSAIAFLIWVVGCAAALVSLVVGGLRFRKLVRAAVPMSEPGWLKQAASIRRRLGMRKNVRILSSAGATTPMTGGLWRPVILLPSSAETWAPDRREVVLAHELVHVRRHDALRHLLGRVAAACYWFHPLGWLASRLSAVASERSCDEEVLALGTRPSEYARHLFSLASETVGRPAAMALGMVQRSQLEDRILSILRRHRPRYSAVGTTSALAAIGMVGTLLACGHPVPREPAPQPSTPENAETERLAAAPPMSEPMEVPPPVTNAPPVESRSVEPAPAPLATPEAVNPQPFQCNPGKWTIVRRRGEWTLQRQVDGLRMCMRNRGNFEIGSQNVATDSADEGSWFVLESQAERLHRLVVTRGPGGLEYDWSIDGRSEVFDDRAREWRDLMLTVMNGYLDVQDVLAEASSLRETGWAHRRHVSGLQRQIGTHQRHVGGLQREIGTHQRHVGGLQRQISTQQLHVSDLHHQLAYTDMEVDRLRREIARMPFAGIQGALRATMQSLELQADRMETESRALRQGIQEYDLAQRVREIEEQIEEYDLDGKIREIEIQIKEYDLDGRIRGIEMEIEEYDLAGKIEEAEGRVEEFDADGRIDEIERSLDDEVAALRRIIG
ncbi:MAG: hypothetical protein OXN92_12220 [Gammaproteobacteria bacterium]|nr:hypothetical protein [Gammaproteobacteria bacterium]